MASPVSAYGVNSAKQSFFYLTPFVPLSFKGEGEVLGRGVKPLSDAPLLIPLHLKPVQVHRLVRVDAGLLAADVNLLVNTIHPFKVGEEQAPPPT